jgi:hypothetical protein
VGFVDLSNFDKTNQYPEGSHKIICF